MSEESKILDIAKIWLRYLEKFLCKIFSSLKEINDHLFSFLRNLTPLVIMFGVGLLLCFKADISESLGIFWRCIFNIFGNALLVISFILYMMNLRYFLSSIDEKGVGYCSKMIALIIGIIMLFVFLIAGIFNFGAMANSLQLTA